MGTIALAAKARTLFTRTATSSSCDASVSACLVPLMYASFTMTVMYLARHNDRGVGGGWGMVSGSVVAGLVTTRRDIHTPLVRRTKQSP